MLVYQGVHTRNWRWFILVNPHLPQQMLVRMMWFQVWVIQESKVASTLQPKSNELKRWIFFPDVYDNQPPLLAFHKDGVVRPKKRWDDTLGSQHQSGGGYPTYGWCSDDIPEMGDICQQERGYSSKISKNNGLKITQIFSAGMHRSDLDLDGGRRVSSTWSMSPQTVRIRGDSRNSCASSCFSSGHLRWPFLGSLFAASRSIKYNFQEIL